MVWLLEEKSWFYHLLPACILTTLALLYWIATMSRPAMGSRSAAFVGMLVIVGLSGVGSAAFSRWREQIEITMGSRPNIVGKLEQLIHSQKARSYIAFSQWIGLGFPVVNNTGVVWSSRFDSMWALVGEVWRCQIDGQARRDWPAHSWVAEDFLAGRPDLAVVDEREGIDYIGTLSSFDPRFKNAWSQYRQIAAFDGLRVFRRQAPPPSRIDAQSGQRFLPLRVAQPG